MTMQKQFPIIIVFLFLLLPTVTSAATISLTSMPKNIGIGDIVRVDVLLDSDIPVNAFSGSLKYSKAVLEPTAIIDGNSIVNLWITHPVIAEKGGPILFAGITPGGFSGNRGALFSVLFRTKIADTANITILDIEVLRNDGEGGKELVDTKPLTFSIGSKSFGSYMEIIDTIPPEAFIPYINNDQELFNGMNYLIFMALDKSSGISHYAVSESRLPSFLTRFFPLSWSTTTSPYVITDQNLTSTIYIKAVDRSGNERISVFPPQRIFTVYEKIVFVGILLIIVFLWQTGLVRRFIKNL